MAKERQKTLEDKLEAAVAAALPQPSDLVVRTEEPKDEDEIRSLLLEAFDTAAEADLVASLRRTGAIVLALVAIEQQKIVGYVAFSRIWVETTEDGVPAVSLAPLAVGAKFRDKGIASHLVREGHACLAAMGESLSVVVGEPGFYGRLGYSRHRASGLISDYPEEYVLAISFADAPRQGALSYPAAFGEL